MTWTCKVLGMKWRKKTGQHCKGRLFLEEKGNVGKDRTSSMSSCLSNTVICSHTDASSKRRWNLRSSDVHLLSWRVHIYTSTHTQQTRIIWTTIYLVYQRVDKYSIYNTKTLLIAICVAYKQFWKWLFNSNLLLLFSFWFFLFVS